MPPKKNDRVLFPATGFSVADAVEYYRGIAKFLLPHLRSRPLSFRRYPGTIDDDAYWDKDAPGFTPARVRTVEVERKNGGAPIEYIVADNVTTLAWIASVGGIELHPFLHRAERLDEATEVVFDLDPGTGAGLVECSRVAILLRDALAAMTLEAWPKVTGSKGLQLYVPLHSGATHEETEPFARTVADAVARAAPGLVVSRMTKAIRTRRVFIDWSQNADYKTTVAVYSLRAKRAEPFVSMPLRWREVERIVDRGDARSFDFTPEDALRRARKEGDLFAPVLKKKQRLPKIAPTATKSKAARAGVEERPAVVLHGVALPRAGTQSGRRLFVLPRTEMGNELWLERERRFTRWILRPDREGGGALIAMNAGNFPAESDYFAGRVPARWKGRVTIDDVGAYETIEHEGDRYELFFTGQTLRGRWRLEKIEPGAKHKSWRLTAVKD